MLFNTTQFFVFLAITLIVFYASPRTWRRYILLAASYYFYMSWIPKFVLLLLALTIIDYIAGLWIARVRADRKKLILILSLSANLGFLGFFKYYNFLVENLARLLREPPNSWALAIILPLGISFHTFQSMSYVIDVYRGEQKPIRSPVDYALFISFFPQLVAGPIVRAREFFRDLYDWHAPASDDIYRGVWLVILGLIKKMALADQFAPIADRYFGNVAANPGILTAWSATLAFSLQIFFDFSGYTDMAIGMARLLGFHFPVNFERPYLATSITDFWRRWHMSLSLWLRDYLYIPLGGNRRGRWMTYRNLILTILLGGLWHGARWNFVIWGGYHGALLSLERTRRTPEPSKSGRAWLDPIRVVLTFALVTVGWIFFRAPNLGDSIMVLRQMFRGPRGIWLIEPWQLALAALSLVLAIAEERRRWFERLVAAPAWVHGSALVLALFCLELFGVTDLTIPFVYFQF